MPSQDSLEESTTTSPSSEVPSGPRAGAPGSGRRRIVRYALYLLGGVAAASLIAWYVVVPYPWGLETGDPGRTALMEQRSEESKAGGAPFQVRQEWIPLEDISPHLVRAVIVAEDYRFREHDGVDWVSLGEEVRWSGDDDFSWLSMEDLDALAEAVKFAWAHRTELRGRSTITQQLAKNLYFGTERTLARKGLELIVSRRLERRLDKDRILEIYLNVVEWGPGIFGAEAAAQTYFGRSASTLTLDQAAALAATLPHPLTSNPVHDPGRMRWRKEFLLDRLAPGRELLPPPVPVREPDVDLRIPSEVVSLDVQAPVSVTAPLLR